MLTILSDHYYDPACQRILGLCSGTVFLGTPHPSFRRQEEWLRLSFILRASSKYSKGLLAQAEIEGPVVANLSLKFQQAGLEHAIVSVYETRSTKIPDGFFRSRRELVRENLSLLDRSLTI